jgi:hypothetical protein
MWTLEPIVSWNSSSAKRHCTCVPISSQSCDIFVHMTRAPTVASVAFVASLDPRVAASSSQVSRVASCICHLLLCNDLTISLPPYRRQLCGITSSPFLKRTSLYFHSGTSQHSAQLLHQRAHSAHADILAERTSFERREWPSGIANGMSVYPEALMCREFHPG